MNYLITIGLNHDKCTKQENFLCGKILLLIDVHKVSSVSARKLKCHSSAWLGSAREISARTHHQALLSNLYTVLNPVFYTRLSKKKLVEAATFVSQKCIFPALSKDSWVLQSFFTEAIKTRKNLPKINPNKSKKYGSNILSIHIKI